MSIIELNKCKEEIKSYNRNPSTEEIISLLDKYQLENDEISMLFDFIEGKDDKQYQKSKLDELYEEYKVVLYKKRRYYLQDLSVRDFSLDNSSPHSFKIENFVIESTSWGDLICKLVEYLQIHHQKDLVDLYEYRTDWTKQEIFSLFSGTNRKKLSESLYVNCNHTAVHACWLIGDILSFYEIPFSDVELLIHRSQESEPLELVEEIEKVVKDKFKEYLMVCQNKNEKSSEIIIANIDKVINRRMRIISSTYGNVFLMDSSQIFYNYEIKLRDKIKDDLNLDQKTKLVLYRYIDYLKDFFQKNNY